jgi:hypothetical protein
MTYCSMCYYINFLQNNNWEKKYETWDSQGSENVDDGLLGCNTQNTGIYLQIHMVLQPRRPTFEKKDLSSNELIE